MLNIKDSLIQECLVILKREDVKSEFKNMLSPVIELIIQQIYPYLYLCLIFVIISFLLHLGIFILLLRNKGLFSKGF
jgi:hypothetical protein